MKNSSASDSMNNDLREFVENLVELLTRKQIQFDNEQLKNLLIKLREQGLAEILKKIKLDNGQALDNESKNLPAVRSAHCDSYISTIDRFSRSLFGGISDIDLEFLLNGGKVKTDTKGKITIFVQVGFEDLPVYMQGKLQDRFTKTVCDVITSLFLKGIKYITPQHIASVMNGYSTHNRQVTDKFLEQIKESVEILSHTWCKIDATHEANAKGYNFKETKFNGILAPIDALEVVLMNGKRVEAYRVLREPILYSYAKQKAQVLNVPIDILALPERVNMTRENIMLQHYLLEEIERMKNPKSKRSRIMLYESIFEVLNALELSKTEKKRIRDRVKLFLDNWIDLAYIKDYHEEKEKGLIRSILIKLFEDEPKN